MPLFTYSACTTWPSTLGMPRAITGENLQIDDMLGRAAVPRFQHLQFAAAIIREGELAPSKRWRNAFSTAGLFYTGNDLCVRAAKNKYKIGAHSTLHHPISICLSSPYGARWWNTVFPSWWWFKGWVDDDNDPWQEHEKWFPNCVYVRYVMEGNAQQLDDDIDMKKHKCTIL